MEDQRPNARRIRFSLTPTDWQLIHSSSSDKVWVRAVGRIVFIHVDAEFASGDSWGTGPLGTVPEGLRPDKTIHIPWSGRDSASHREVVVQTDGVVKYNNRGGAQNSGSWDVDGSWVAA